MLSLRKILLDQKVLFSDLGDRNPHIKTQEPNDPILTKPFLEKIKLCLESSQQSHILWALTKFTSAFKLFPQLTSDLNLIFNLFCNGSQFIEYASICCCFNLAKEEIPETSILIFKTMLERIKTFPAKEYIECMKLCVPFITKDFINTEVIPAIYQLIQMKDEHKHCAGNLLLILPFTKFNYMEVFEKIINTEIIVNFYLTKICYLISQLQPSDWSINTMPRMFLPIANSYVNLREGLLETVLAFALSNYQINSSSNQPTNAQNSSNYHHGSSTTQDYPQMEMSIYNFVLTAFGWAKTNEKVGLVLLKYSEIILPQKHSDFVLNIRELLIKLSQSNTEQIKSSLLSILSRNQSLIQQTETHLKKVINNLTPYSSTFSISSPSINSTPTCGIAYTYVSPTILNSTSTTSSSTGKNGDKTGTDIYKKYKETFITYFPSIFSLLSPKLKTFAVSLLTPFYSDEKNIHNEKLFSMMLSSSLILPLGLSMIITIYSQILKLFSQVPKYKYRYIHKLCILFTSFPNDVLSRVYANTFTLVNEWCESNNHSLLESTIQVYAKFINTNPIPDAASYAVKLITKKFYKSTKCSNRILFINIIKNLLYILPYNVIIEELWGPIESLTSDPVLDVRGSMISLLAISMRYFKKQNDPIWKSCDYYLQTISKEADSVKYIDYMINESQLQRDRERYQQKQKHKSKSEVLFHILPASPSQESIQPSYALPLSPTGHDAGSLKVLKSPIPLQQQSNLGNSFNSVIINKKTRAPTSILSNKQNQPVTRARKYSLKSKLPYRP